MAHHVTMPTHSGVRPAVALGLAVAATLLVASPAHAGVSGTISAGSGVIFDDCRFVELPYSLSVTPDVDSWSMDVNVYSPDGTLAESDFIWHESDPATGNAKLQICGYEDPGTYEVRTEGTWSDYDADRYDVPFSLPDTTLKLRAAKTKTKASGKQGNKFYLIKVSVKDERPNGYYPTELATVKAEVRRKGKWVPVPGSKEYTNDRGRVTFTAGTAGPPYKVRFVTQASGNYSKSVSNAVRVP